MFDVSWTDPARETVGQRKNRKDQQTNRLSRDSSVRSLNSSGSQSQSQSHNRPSLLNLFGSGSQGTKTGPKRTDSPSKVPTQSAEDASIKTSRRISSFTVTTTTTDTGPEYASASRVQSNDFFPEEAEERYPSDHEHSSTSDGEIPESVFSEWTCHSGNTDSSWSSSPNTGKFMNECSSFITQTTEITASPRDSIKADEQIAKIVSLSPVLTMPVEIRDTEGKGSKSSSTFEFPLPNTNQRPESLILPPSPKAEQVDSRPTTWSVSAWGRRRQSDSWRPPEEWQCLDEVQENSGLASPEPILAPILPLRNTRRKHHSQELTHPQRNIRRMDAASSKIVLERLKEEWLGVADASVYRELELDKQLWMLTALQHLKKKNSMDLSFSVETVLLEQDSTATKLLSLYENHASASFLSALHPTPRIHHISTTPLSPSSYPNIQPLSVQSPTPILPYASNLFTSIHAFSLPAILPASSVPTLLRECHRTLRSSLAPANTVPGLLHPSSPDSPASFSSSSTRTIIPFKPKALQKAGSIHLTILDPAPLPDTLGPKLRAWLNTHLLLNLEKQFRCINPGRLFPIWLADAGLRGEGSRIVMVQFLACIHDAASIDEDAEVIMKRELKSVVGRMLWKEMWGSFVEGDRWWWEDEEIVEECGRLGTRWEYAVIEGVREG